MHAFRRFWRNYVGAIAFVAVLVVGAVGFWQIDNAVDSINTERSNRALVQTEINRYVCNENNKQDRILAKLIAVSIAGAEDRPLTGRQLRAYKVFLRAFRQLRAETPCNQIANAFLEASTTEDYEAIRRILRAQMKRQEKTETGGNPQR